MPLTGLTGEAQVRFSQLLKNGVSYRTALALADRVTDADLSVITGGGGGGGTAGVTSINGKTGVIATLAPADVGLGNVNNTSDANKPVSTATATALAAKAPIASPTFTGNVGGITKTMVGLGNVDNTADTAKPLSTAATAALAAKADLASGKVPTSQLPSIALVASVSVADQAAMLALTAAQVQPGDVAVRPDGSWMLGGTGDPAVLGNWTQIATPGGGGAVASVNGHTGVVVLGAADVSADPAGAASTAQANAIAASDAAGAAATAQANAIAASLQRASNLSDLADKRASRGNIEVVRLISSPTAPAAPVSDDLWIDESTNAANGAYLPYALNQRGAWATATTYALGDLVLAPTGDYVVPKAPFTTGAAYDASNWNIVVPAQNYGRELTGAESTADFNLNGLTGWQDIPGLTGTIPAGIPFVVDLAGLVAAVQGTAASGSIVGIQFRLTDAATATTVYAFAWRQFAYSAASGQTIWQSISGLRRNAALGAATAVKAQAQVGVVAGQGNIGFFPASGGGGEPTTFLVRGR